MASWLKGALLLLVTFGAGVALGVGYERRHGPAHEAAAMDAHHVLQHFSRELGLDSAQVQAIRSILTRHQTAVDSAWHAMQPRVSATLDSTLQEILGVLRPEQVTRYRKMIEEMHPGALRQAP